MRRKAHSRCIMAHIEERCRRRPRCPHCQEDLSFGKGTNGSGQKVSLPVHRPPDSDAVLTDDEYDPPSDVDDKGKDPDFEI